MGKVITRNADRFCEFFFGLHSLQVYSDLLVGGYAELMRWEVELDKEDIPIEEVPLDDLEKFMELVKVFGTGTDVLPRHAGGGASCIHFGLNVVVVAVLTIFLIT